MDWTTQLFWYGARATGLVAFGLLTAAVCLGLVLSLKWRSVEIPRFVTNEVHRFVTTLALVFTVLHGLSLYFDSFMKFTPSEILVPLASHYRPVWVALGITAAYLMAAIYLSQYVQRLVGWAWWRRLHYLTFAVYLAVVVHGLGTGSDSQAPWAFFVYAGSVSLVTALLAARLLTPDRAGRRAWGPAAVMGGGLLVLGGWAFAGPLQPGWNAVANNGNGSGARQPVAAAAAPPRDSLRLPFQVQLSGQMQQRGGDEQTTLEYDTNLQGAPGGTMQLRLIGQLLGGSRLRVNSSSVVLTPAGAPPCTGQVTQIERGAFLAQCATPQGQQVQLQIVVQLDANGNVVGTLEGDQG